MQILTAFTLAGLLYYLLSVGDPTKGPQLFSSGTEMPYSSAN